MKQITINIKESRFRFFMELIRSFDFVTVTEPAHPVREANDGDNREALRANVRRGLKEVKLIEAGKLKGRPAHHLLDEL